MRNRRGGGAYCFASLFARGGKLVGVQLLDRDVVGAIGRSSSGDLTILAVILGGVSETEGGTVGTHAFELVGHSVAIG